MNINKCKGVIHKNMNKIFLNLTETAQYLNMPKYRIYQFVKTKRFPAKKVGKSWLIHKELLDRWAEQMVRL